MRHDYFLVFVGLSGAANAAPTFPLAGLCFIVGHVFLRF